MVEYTSQSSDDRRDDVYSFFQNCYHLKDWLKNDPATRPIVSPDIEDFIKKSDELRIVADLCNGSKHLDLSARGHRPKTGDPSTGVTRTDIDILIGSGGRQTFWIKSNTVDYEAYELARKSVEQWEIYLHGRNLL